MKITLKLGNVTLSFISEQSSACSSSIPPEVESFSVTENEKHVKLTHFSGIVKLIISSNSDVYNPYNSFAPNKASVMKRNDHYDRKRRKKSTLNSAKNRRRKNETFLESTLGAKQPVYATMHDERKKRESTMIIDSDVNFTVRPPSSINPATTPFHSLCASSHPHLQEMQLMLNSNPDLVFVPDTEGRLPLHLLSRNENLFRNEDDRVNVEAFTKRMIRAYPESIIHKDAYGRIPFADAIGKWIDTEHSRTDRDVIIIPDFMHGLHSYNMIIPQYVSLPPNVDWGISVLSHVVDYSKREIRREIVTDLASIPFLLKTFLLIHDDDIRLKVFNSTLISRLLIEPKTVGLWIIPLLKANGEFSSRCIDYFDKVANVTIRNFIGRQRSAEPSDYEAFRKRKKIVFDRIGKSRYFISALCELCKLDRERAATTPIVQSLLEETIEDNFVYSSFYNDVFMLLALLLQFRVVSWNQGIMSVFPQTRAMYNDGLLFDETNEEIYSILIICSYFLIRLTSQSIALLTISLRVFRRAFLHTYLLHLCTSILVIICCIVIWEQCCDLKKVGALLSCTMGALWICLIDYLRTFSKPLAIFVRATHLLILHILWFALLLTILIFMFTDMMHIFGTLSGECGTHFTNSSTFDTELYRGLESSYNNETFYSENPQKDFENLLVLYDNMDSWCTASMTETYAAGYSIFLGQFNMEKIMKIRYILVLFIMFTALTTVLLLSSLIHVVIETYRKVKDKSEQLYALQRIDFAAEQSALKDAMLSNLGENRSISLVTKVNCYFSWFVFFYTTVATIVLCILNIIIISENENSGVRYYSIYDERWKRSIYAAIQVFALLIIQFFKLDYLVAFYFRHSGGRLWRIRAKIYRFFRGLSPRHLKFPLNETIDDWDGRLIGIESATNDIVKESEKRICKLVQSSEDRIIENELKTKASLIELLEHIHEKNEYESDCSTSSSEFSKAQFHVLGRKDIFS